MSDIEQITDRENHRAFETEYAGHVFTINFMRQPGAEGLLDTFMGGGAVASLWRVQGDMYRRGGRGSIPLPGQVMSLTADKKAAKSAMRVLLKEAEARGIELERVT